MQETRDGDRIGHGARAERIATQPITSHASIRNSFPGAYSGHGV
jgi:hypothetical protein